MTLPKRLIIVNHKGQTMTRADKIEILLDKKDASLFQEYIEGKIKYEEVIPMLKEYEEKIELMDEEELDYEYNER